MKHYIKLKVLTKYFLYIFLTFSTSTYMQNTNIPEYFRYDESLTNFLTKLANKLDINKNFDVGEDGIEQISLAVIALNSDSALIGGVNLDNFIYPASVYKMYVAAEVLNQIDKGLYKLDSPFIVKSPNNVDKIKEIKNDPRPLLKDYDTVTVNYLLDLMITRSDNSAANCLIDLAQRENINKLITSYNWHGSEVTRKFLSRKFEDAGYEDIRGTETCALHAADFMYRIYNDKLINFWVSRQMKSLLSRQLDNTKLSQGLPNNTIFSHKTGWFSYWTNDVGIIEDENVKYIISCFLPIEEELALPIFKKLSGEIYEYMLQKHHN